ncbi:MAG: serine hydrolase [Candidatus Aminicenantes bacterium]
MNIRKTFLLLPVFLFLFGSHLIASLSIEEKVDEYLSVYLETNRFSGAVLIAKGGDILISKGYGYANHELSVVNTPDMIFRLGSITKTFTAMLIMQLHEEGDLSVHDPISKYIPDYPNGETITIHHLMSHTAGIPNFTSFPEYTETMMVPSTLDELIDRFRDNPLEFEPGGQHKYSNSGYILLGYIIEKVTGKSYADYVQEQIFDAVGMDNSGYDDHRKIIPNRASGYEFDGRKLMNASYIDMSIPHAAGALYSTVEDLYKWDRVLHTGRLLNGELIQKMFTPVLNNYAYGWAAGTMFNKKVISHGGGINGFQSNMARFVDDDICIIVLSNIIPAPVSEITKDLAAIALGEPYDLPEKRTAIELPEEILERYVGEYQLAPDFILSVTQEGTRIFTQATGQQRVEIYPSSETEFFLTVVKAEIHFILDDNGAVTGLVLHQDGRKMPAEKID